MSTSTALIQHTWKHTRERTYPAQLCLDNHTYDSQEYVQSRSDRDDEQTLMVDDD